MSTVIQPEGWVAPKGYSNGILASGRLVFTGGQIGWNPRVTPPEFSVSFAEQFEQALSNEIGRASCRERVLASV